MRGCPRCRWEISPPVNSFGPHVHTKVSSLRSADVARTAIPPADLRRYLRIRVLALRPYSPAKSPARSDTACRTDFITRQLPRQAVLIQTPCCPGGVIFFAKVSSDAPERSKVSSDAPERYCMGNGSRWSAHSATVISTVMIHSSLGVCPAMRQVPSSTLLKVRQPGSTEVASY